MELKHVCPHIGVPYVPRSYTKPITLARLVSYERENVRCLRGQQCKVRSGGIPDDLYDLCTETQNIILEGCDSYGGFRKIGVRPIRAYVMNALVSTRSLELRTIGE